MIGTCTLFHGIRSADFPKVLYVFVVNISGVCSTRPAGWWNDPVLARVSGPDCSPFVGLRTEVRVEITFDVKGWEPFFGDLVSKGAVLVEVNLEPVL